MCFVFIWDRIFAKWRFKKLDSLRPGSREIERGRWEGQNFQLNEVQREEEEEEEEEEGEDIYVVLVE